MRANLLAECPISLAERYSLDVNLERQADERLLRYSRPPQAGDAFGVFYVRHERLVLGFHMARVKDAERAADLTAETFERALRARPRFSDRGPGSAVAWLLGIARNVWLNDQREPRRAVAARTFERPLLRDETVSAIEETASREHILGLIARLPRAQQEAVSAFVIDDDSYAEIAAKLGCETQTIRKRVSRGLATLRATYQEDR